MRYLEDWQIKWINTDIVHRTGGARGAVNEANLTHACLRAKTLPKSIIKIAAFYLHFFAYTGHVFTDGNKRTAMTVVIAFLFENGKTLSVEEDELVGMALLAASGQKNIKAIEKWLKPRVISLQKR